MADLASALSEAPQFDAAFRAMFAGSPVKRTGRNRFLRNVLIAIGNSLVQPTLNGLASRSVEASWQGRALGLLQSAASLGRGIGPVIGGVLLHLDVSKDGHPLPHYGRTPFWVSAAFMVVTLVLAAGLRLPGGHAATVQGTEVDTAPAAEL